MMMKFQVRMVTNLEIRKYIVLGKEVIRAFIFFFFLVSTMFHYFICAVILQKYSYFQKFLKILI